MLPTDMTPDYYSSEHFKRRAVRLIERLGILWDADPIVAFVELGIFGKWGEQEKPFATKEIQKLVADVCEKPLKKILSVRLNWEIFHSQPFGEYWDSLDYFDKMWSYKKILVNLIL